MVPAICTQCGAQVNVDASQETAFCSFCGAKFIIEKAVNNYNIKSANIGHADTINVYTGDSPESLTDRAFIMLNDNQSRKARELFDEALNKNPRYWKAYLGLFMFSRGIRNEESIEKEIKSISGDRNFKHAVEYAPQDIKMRLVGYANSIDLRLKREQDEKEKKIAEAEELKRKERELKSIKEKSNNLLILSIAGVLFSFSGYGIIICLVSLYLVYQYRMNNEKNKVVEIAYYLSLAGTVIAVISLLVIFVSGKINIR